MHSKERSLEHPSYMTDGCQNEILIEAGLSGVVLGLSVADLLPGLMLGWGNHRQGRGDELRGLRATLSYLLSGGLEDFPWSSMVKRTLVALSTLAVLSLPVVTRSY